MKVLMAWVLVWVSLTVASVQAGQDGDDGVVRVASAYSVEQTAARLQQLFKAKGVRLFARVDHAAGAAQAGLALRPTLLLIFGKPQLGTPLMQCQQRLALDLPQKALVYEDAAGKVWVAYNDPAYLRQRYRVAACEAAFAKVEAALSGLIAKATR